MNQMNTPPVVELEEAPRFYTRWWRTFGSGLSWLRDLIAEAFGAVGKQRFDQLDESVWALREQIGDMRREHNKAVVNMADKHRQDLADSNAALMTMLAVMGIEPGEIHDALQAKMEGAWQLADAWEDHANELQKLLQLAQLKQQTATHIGRQLGDVFGWMPLAQETLPSLALPDAPPASGSAAEAA